MNRHKLLMLVCLLLSASLLSSNVSARAAGGISDATIRRYPVVPQIGGQTARHVRYLVRIGKRLGNRLDVFSKVGDSITQFSQFLTPVSTGGLRLGTYTNLQRVVSFFSQEPARTNFSFANDSLAAHGGWTSGDVLNPAKDRPGACNPGETPLDCELRITKPSVALIMFGTNDLIYGNLDVFRANIDQIVSITEAHGVIPIVSTIPLRKDSYSLHADVNAYNMAIISVARAHAVPIWNFWLAMDGLPNNGISTDQVHPSIPPDGNTAIFDGNHLSYGFPMRNLTALEALTQVLVYLY